MKCPNCGGKKDRDVIAALGVCQSCVTRETIDELMRGFMRRRSRALPDLPPSPMRTLLDYVRDSHVSRK